jgi:hypothetical protein
LFLSLSLSLSLCRERKPKRRKLSKQDKAKNEVIAVLSKKSSLERVLEKSLASMMKLQTIQMQLQIASMDIPQERRQELSAALNDVIAPSGDGAAASDDDEDVESQASSPESRARAARREQDKAPATAANLSIDFEDESA